MLLGLKVYALLVTFTYLNKSVRKISLSLLLIVTQTINTKEFTLNVQEFYDKNMKKLKGKRIP